MGVGRSGHWCFIFLIFQAIQMGSHNKEQLSYCRIPSSPPETSLRAHGTLLMLLPNSLSPPAMDQMSVSPQIHVLNPNPKMWWYLEMGTLG